MLTECEIDLREELVTDLKRFGSITAVAQRAGVHRETIRAKAVALGIDVDATVGKQRRGRSASVYTRTGSGIRLYLTAPTADMIMLEDIARALSRNCRFTGHTKRFFSVAEHSVNVALRVLLKTGNVRWALVALFHDAHEAYIGDMSTPLKGLVGPKYGKIAAKLDKAIAAAFGLEADWDQAYVAMKEADIYWLYTEALEMEMDGCELVDGVMVPGIRDWVPDSFVHDEDLQEHMGPEEAEKLFLETFYKLAA